MSYYERWFVGLVTLLVKSGLVTREEVESGKRAPGSAVVSPPRRGENEPAAPAGERNRTIAPRFRVGQRVLTRKSNPTGHTRLPRYARGRQGIIRRDYGVYVFPDTLAHFQGEKPQHVYSVRFPARELWGDQAKPQDSVYLDMWDDYLEPIKEPI